MQGSLRTGISERVKPVRAFLRLGDVSLNELVVHTSVRVRTITQSKLISGRFPSPQGCLLLMEGNHAPSPDLNEQLPCGLALSEASDCPEHVMQGPCSMQLMSLTRDVSH